MKIKVSDLVCYMIGVLIGFVRGFLSERHFRIPRYFYAVTSIFLILVAALFLNGCQGKNDLDEREDVVQAAENLSESENNISAYEKVNTEILPEDEEREDDIQEQEPICDFVTKLSDIHAEKDSIVTFRCYYPDAVQYIWEIYEEGRWKTIEGEESFSKVDELYRKTSVYMTLADKEKQVRCKVSLVDGSSVVEEASLYLLPQKVGSILAEAYTAKAGEYVDSLSIPVEIIYLDGSKETITGLNGLCFWDTKEESTEQSTTETGGMKETITTVYTASEYKYMAVGEEEGRIRYQDQDITILLCGEDQTAPIIQEPIVSEFQVSDGNTDLDTVTVTFQADDDISMRSALEYAFLPAEAEPQEGDWSSKASFEVELTENGTWTAYCRDESGNIATREKELIAVDNKAPIVKLQLAQESWCQENRIIVEAEDDSTVQYCYRCTSLKIDSGWISQSTYTVKENGTWKVSVKDAAGNMTEEEISIDNIDTEPPVIRGIEIKENSGGEAKTDGK